MPPGAVFRALWGVSLLLKSTASFREEGGVDCVVRELGTCEEFVFAIGLRDDL